MQIPAFVGDPDRLSRLELVSLYINGYYGLDPGLRSRFEAAFAKRRLPLPSMPPVELEPPLPRVEPPMSRGTFVSYLLLIYSGTAFFYSWLYIAARLAKMDFREEPRHKMIQTAIALAYVAIDLLVADCVINME
jgi:hypothetical protein